MFVEVCVRVCGGALKLLQIVANLLPLIFATIKEIHPPKVRHPATHVAAFHVL